MYLLVIQDRDRSVFLFRKSRVVWARCQNVGMPDYKGLCIKNARWPGIGLTAIQTVVLSRLSLSFLLADGCLGIR
ncbi:hypothetical protein SAMN05216325_107151 [Nitrosomonas marina]|uniref:Uncharacterized protein n=1 Tax=Nitrosomonas marina TaxID=917 RepID=A0A1H8DQW9_9PROT|nr:hypothetical protein SAMN05216325_107151 [Nitrosomonas marina]